MCKFENNGVTKKFSAKESPKMIKECWTKVLMVEILRIIFGGKIDNNKNNEKNPHQIF
jgi:hypothetical protein